MRTCTSPPSQRTTLASPFLLALTSPTSDGAAVTLAVSGPGQIHGIAGLANAWSNNWPMILLGGASFAEQESMGGFQEAPQIAAAKPFCKYAARPDSLERVPYFVEVAVRMATHGRT